MFLVDTEVKGQGGNATVIVLLDGDNGIDIDQCAEVSRYLGNYIEENEMMENKYRLEVSSPGIDQPLKLHRQFVKNIGRDLNVSTYEGDSIKGKLIEATEEGVVLNELIEQPKKANKYKEDRIELSFDTIEKAKVLISFN